MRRLFAIVIIFLSCETLLFSEDCVGPLLKLPNGWVYLPYECIDSSCGTYLDTVTGSKVEFDVGFSAATGEWVEKREAIMRFGTVRVGADAKQCLNITWTYPYPKYEEHTFSWNFSTCSKEATQISRISELLHVTRLNLQDHRWCQGHISHQEMSKVQTGMNYEEVSKLLGSVSNGDVTDQEFKLVYQPKPEVKKCVSCDGLYYYLYFDFSGKLVSHKFERNW